MFDFQPGIGGNDPILTRIFSEGLIQPPTRLDFVFLCTAFFFSNVTGTSKV